MARRNTTFATLSFLVPIAAVALCAANDARAATPTYYNDAVTFGTDINLTVTDDYSNPGYVFIQDNALMSGVLGEVDYMSTGFNNLNIITNMANDPRYCAGCNGSFELSFQTTSVGDATGVVGVGFDIDSHSQNQPYFAFITFADGTTDNIQLPPAPAFWGVAAPERIERIHVGLTMGGTTQSGSISIDNLTVGDGVAGPCVVDADCNPDLDPCTDEACGPEGICIYPPNNDPCDDGELCTEDDVCNMGVCAGTTIDCEDGNECTTNFCQDGVGCILQLNNDPCDDMSVCTENDVCDQGMCGGTLIDCDDGDLCSVDGCDPEMGCTNEPAMGCCTDDAGCGPDEMCDLGKNVCVPNPSGSTGSTGGGDSDTGNDVTGADGTGMATDDAGESDTGLASTGVGVTGTLDTGDDANTTSGGAGSITADGGAADPELPSGCACTTAPSKSRGAWWMMAALGLVIGRRRRSRMARRG
ncbi:MAG: hypothetical protein K0V04_37455 [Deltaproteobacteria bacterium]|nr:hypothetical protein [Deltaproteobacteria bacterium]